MKTKFPFKELRTIAHRLPQADNLALPDFERTAIPTSDSLSTMARAYMRAYKPIMDSGCDLSGVPKQFETAYRLAIACAIHNTLRTTGTKEATLAGVALPTFTRQKLMMIMRAYPKLIAPQIVGFTSMRGPTALIGYFVSQYADPYTASSPAIAAGDNIDDATKANKGFTLVAEGDQARKNKFRIAKQTITAASHRVLGEWSQDLVEDAAADWDVDAESEHMDNCVRLMGQTIDCTAIDAIVAGLASGHQKTFDATPAASPAYDSLSPSEQRAYDEKLIRTGWVSVTNAIERTNQWGDSAQSDWVLCSPNAAQLLEGLKGFTVKQGSPDTFSVGSGPIRYLGEFTTYGGGLRVFSSPFYNRGETTHGKFLFGRQPKGVMDPGIRIAMYVPLEFTDKLYDPNTDTTTKGVRSRFAVATKDGSVADSDQLTRVYGELDVTL